jgi:uncharacterized repeat protein (TIGR01451 family)
MLFNRLNRTLLLVVGLTALPFGLFGQPGNFAPPQEIASTATTGYTRLTIADFNNDSTKDIIANDPIAMAGWYENQGNGNFQYKTLIPELDSSFVLNHADLDQDQDPDIIGSSMDSTPLPISLVWLPNKGGTLDTSNTIGSFSKLLYKTEPADFDQDGDIDLAWRAGRFNSNIQPISSHIGWVENLGNGNFDTLRTLQANLPDSTYHSRPVMEAGDLNGDGKPDLLCSSLDSVPAMIWYERQSNGFSGPKVIAAQDSQASAVQIADFDQDSDQDVAVVSEQNSRIAWYENQGGGNFGAQQVLSTAFDSVAVLQIGDLNNDGRPDILAGDRKAELIGWLPNQGGGHFGTVQWLPYEASGIDHIRLADVSGDGALDIVAATDSGIVWYANDYSADHQIEGRVFRDANSNGQYDAGEPALQNKKVFAKGGITTVTQTDSAGHYRMPRDSGAYKLQVTQPQYWTFTTPAAGHYQDTMNSNSPDTLAGRDFGLRPLPNVQDLRVSLTPYFFPVPGQTFGYAVTYENEGTKTVQNPTVQLVFHDSLKLDSASVTLTQAGGDTLAYTVPSPLQPGDQGSFKLHFSLPPLAALVGDSVFSWVRIQPSANDTTPQNNVTTLLEAILGAVDPNDKQVMNNIPEQAGDVPAAENTMDYRIRFQNTGTAPAFDIRIEDTLSKHLRPETFRMVAASHDYTLNIRTSDRLDRTIVIWRFKDIMLPDSGTNEPASHGFVRFRIERDSSLTLGDSVRNRAGIYFDFNPVVLTNYATGTLDTPATTLRRPAPAAPQADLNFRAYPNPSNGTLHFRGNFRPGKPLQLRVLNLQGRVVAERALAQPQAHLDLPKGLYVVQLRQGDRRGRAKVMLR